MSDRESSELSVGEDALDSGSWRGLLAADAAPSARPERRIRRRRPSPEIGVVEALGRADATRGWE
jgi:hypothetical protein